MSVRTSTFVDVAARSRELGCLVPVSIALLPGNFATAADADEFCYHAATPHVRSVWQSIGLEDEGPEARDTTPSGSQAMRKAPDQQTGAGNESAQVPLAVFFGAGLIGGPTWRLTVALGMVARVLALHPDCASPSEVRFDAVVERQGGNGYACLQYCGDAYGLVALARDVRRISAGD